jgi:hypothetical protein
MAFIKVNALFVVVFLAAACPLNAQILNGSFDANSTLPTSWQIDQDGVPPEIRQIFSTFESPYPSNTEVNLPPFDDQYFLLLKSDDRRHPQTNFSQISQKITVHAGQRISGVYFFSTGDYIPYDDTATIKLIPDPCSNSVGLTEILLAKKSVADVNSYQCMSGWETFTHDFNDANAGTYTLTLRVADAIDNIYTSRLAVDALKIECIYVLAGDINSDCIVNFLDFALLANQWLGECTPEQPCSANINEPTPDNIVDFADLAVLAEHWLIDCGVIDPDPAICEPRSSPQ